MSDPRLAYCHRRHVAPVSDAPAVEATDVSADYQGTPALAGISLRVPVASIVALVGPNGAGKSSLLKAIAGLLPTRGGPLRIYGHPVGACHHRVAYLPQRSEIDWQFPLSVERLVLAGRYPHLGWLRGPQPEDRAIAGRMIARLGLESVARRQIGQLSGGQQQRALLARALAQDADLLLLDEPLSAVDVETRGAVGALLDELRSRGKSALVATHDIGGQEGVFDHALFLKDGRQARPEEIHLGHVH
jgi:manganese/zinc/iron transport system ATP- binding protein